VEWVSALVGQSRAEFLARAVASDASKRHLGRGSDEGLFVEDEARADVLLAAEIWRPLAGCELGSRDALQAVLEPVVLAVNYYRQLDNLSFAP